MNIWSLVLALAVIVILLILPCGSCRENLEVLTLDYAKRALQEVTSKKVRAPKNSIDRIVFTNVKMVPKEKTIFENFFNTETILFSGNPKYVSSKSNTVIVGKRIQVEATGKSMEEAKARVNKKANGILNDIRRNLQTAGLMTTPLSPPR